MERNTLLDIYRSALSAADGGRLVQQALQGISGTFALVALGKAAASMTMGALSVESLRITRGFVCHPHAYEPFTPPGTGTWSVHRGGHPVPDAGSFDAGAALVQWLEELSPALPLLVLMSGGSSACIEHLGPGVAREEVIQRTRRMLASGADIRALNAARSEWSALKRGRALRIAGLREVLLLALTDVPGDDPAFVGSGPFYAASPSVRVQVTGTNRLLMEAAVAAAGPSAHIAGSLEGEAAQCGARLAKAILDAAPGTMIWGGETTVRLPEHPGRGGRCQHLALAAARVLDGVPEVAIIAVGSDGIDGDSEDAGAIVDGTTAGRLRAAGIDIDATLAAADAGSALAEIGALVNTGPTGTNLMDLVIARRCAPSRA